MRFIRVIEQLSSVARLLRDLGLVNDAERIESRVHALLS